MFAHVTWANRRILVNVNCGYRYLLICCRATNFGLVMRITVGENVLEFEYSLVTKLPPLMNSGFVQILPISTTGGYFSALAIVIARSELCSRPVVAAMCNLLSCLTGREAGTRAWVVGSVPGLELRGPASSPD